MALPPSHGPSPPLIFWFPNLFRHMVGLLGRVISSSQGLYLHRTTQHRKTWTNIHALSGIRTRDPVYERSIPASQTARPLDRHPYILLTQTNEVGDTAEHYQPVCHEQDQRGMQNRDEVCSQQPATGPYPVLNRSSSRTHTDFQNRF
jgi:hypothetical protein